MSVRYSFEIKCMKDVWEGLFTQIWVTVILFYQRSHLEDNSLL